MILKHVPPDPRLYTGCKQVRLSDSTRDLLDAMRERHGARTYDRLIYAALCVLEHYPEGSL